MKVGKPKKMANDGEKLYHSDMLFTTDEGLPMSFRIRPSEEKVRLVVLVKHGGGNISSHQKNEDTINLYIEGDKAIPENAVKVQYIYDCVAQDKQLNIEDYRVPKDAPVANGRPPSPSTSIISTSSTVRGRSKYTDEEDDAILCYIARNPNVSYGGNVIWKKMEMMQLTSHSWQSMRDRFNKKLQSRLPGYIKKYKSGVLEKYGFTTSESSAEEDKGEKFKKGPSSKIKNRNTSKKSSENDAEEEEVMEVDEIRNVNNNNDDEEDMDGVSNDSFDESLMQDAVTEKRQSPRKSKPLKVRLNFVAGGKRNGAGDSGKQTQKNSDAKEGSETDKSDGGESDHMKTRSQSDKSDGGESDHMKTRSQSKVPLQDTNSRVQCSRVTQSNEAASASPAKMNTRLASKRKPAQSDETDSDNINNTPSNKGFRSPKKLAPPKPSKKSKQLESNDSSSQDTEAKDSAEEFESWPIMRKTRQAGGKKSLRKSSRRKVAEAESDSSSAEEEDPPSNKTQRLDHAAIDKIIQDKKATGKGDETIKSNSDISGDADSDAETQMEVKDSLPDSEDGNNTVEALDEDVDAIEEIMSKFSISAEAALYAVYINSGDVDAACHYINTGQPPNGHTVWKREDDQKLSSANAEDIRNLVEKFGQEQVLARQQYLES